MSTLVLSRHAETRMRQRGLRSSDLDIILRCGSEIDGDVFLSDKDVTREIQHLSGEIRHLTQLPSSFADNDREIHCRKRQIRDLERLRGWKLGLENGTAITCYRPNRRNRKRLFQRGRGNA